MSLGVGARQLGHTGEEDEEGAGRSLHSFARYASVAPSASLLSRILASRR